MILHLEPKRKVDFLEAVAKSIGTRIVGNTITLPPSIGTGFIKGLEINPHLHVIIRQYQLKEEWVLKGIVGAEQKEVVMIAFHNIFPGKNESTNRKFLPSVQVTTAGLDYRLTLPARKKMNSIVVAVHSDYLRELLHPQTGNSLLKIIVSGKQSVLFEEIISPAIQAVAAEMVEAQPPVELRRLYFKTKTEELIYLLFAELLKREHSTLQTVNIADVKQIYKVKDKILSSIDSPPRLSELSRLSGMSESKLKRLFRQIFGNSIYHYYQGVRMKQAAYLLREKGLMVSEVGHQLGFSNLSHFSRLFEAHVGVKPKKYSRETGRNIKTTA